MRNTKNKLKLTSRGRHAVMAMVELAKHGQDNPVPLSEIASAATISISYLEQLFAGLRRNGLVRSYRGPGGGYILARPAQDITVSDILISAEDSLPAKRAANSNETEEGGNVQTIALMSHISDVLHDFTQGISLDDVMAGRYTAPRSDRQ
ncbi:MAG: Rrf2 family transcriptional regulator [Alphaproteobacteria bacterium]|nr:Rrf2 family transcriptional regulator [Alphaproteobacteria bacterium]